MVDAEIVVPDPAGRRLDWDALLLRIHPAASQLEETVSFDLAEVLATAT